MEFTLEQAVIIAFTLAALMLAFYSGYKGLQGYRILDAIAHAPLADLRSNAAGLVKLRGTAQPPPAQSGKSPSSIIWYSRSTRSGSSSSTLTTTDNFLLQDNYGVCAVDSAKANIEPTVSESSHAFLNSSNTRTEEVIHANDPVFAIGEIRRDLPPLAGIPAVDCQLAKSGGVLLFSGASERDVKVLYRLWLAVQMAGVVLCLALAVFCAMVYIEKYPPAEGSAADRALVFLLRVPPQGATGGEPPSKDKGEASPAEKP